MISRIAAGLFCAAIWTSPLQATAAPPHRCDQYQKVVDWLFINHAETRRAIGIAEHPMTRRHIGVLELYVSVLGSWSVIFSDKKRTMACVIIFGKGWNAETLQR